MSSKGGRPNESTEKEEKWGDAPIGLKRKREPTSPSASNVGGKRHRADGAESGKPRDEWG